MWVLPMGCSSSQAAPAWVPSTGCSLSGTDYSNIRPPQGQKSCQKNLLQHKLLFMQSQTLQGAYSIVGSLQGHSLLQAYPPAPAWSPPQAAGGYIYLLHHGSSWAARGQPHSPWSSSQAAGKSLPQHLEYLLPLLLY